MTRTLAARRLALAGALAAGPGLLLLVVANLVTSRIGFIEAISDGVTAYIPVDVFSSGLETFGPLAKGLLHIGVAGGVLAAAALLAIPAARATASMGWLRAGTWIGLLGIVIAEGLVLPLFGAGFFGVNGGTDPLALHVPLAIASLAYGLLLSRARATSQHPAPAPASADRPEIVVPGEQPDGMTRRSLLGRTIALVGGGSLLAAFGSLTVQALGNVKPAASLTGGPTAADGFGPTPALTPVPDFYQVSKNLLATNVDGTTWRLTVDGLVDRPLSLTLDELIALPSVTGYRTMECISTSIVRGDHLIGNQKWRGVRISDLLDRAGVKPGAGWILWEAEDGFTESTPLEVAREADSWIVYEMGDALLTPEHGYPARVLIAGRFGMKQPKWLRRMQVADHDEDGYWVVRGWDKEALVRPMSRIDYPRSLTSVPVGEAFWLTGVANTGDRGVMRVEISLDGGKTWADAEVDDAAIEPLGPLTWVRWRHRATLPTVGAYSVAVRTTDGSGLVQDGAETDPLPSGATGWHRIRLNAVASG